MECMHCKGRMVKSTAPFDVNRRGYHIHWDALPAWVRIQCGEAYFEGEEVSRIQKSISILEREVPLQEAV